MEGILSEVKVLELTHAPSGAFCAKLLADQGADTIKVEPPGTGDCARQEPPFIDGEPHPDRSTTFLALNTNKRGITLDLAKPEGRALFLKLAADADVIIESFQPGRLSQLGLGYDVLRRENPKAILLSITYFGQHGPYASYKGDDLIAQAMGGFLYAVTGPADKPPMGMRETMARGVVIGLVQSPEQVVSSPHLAERDFFVELDHPEVGTLKYPGPGFFLDGANPMQRRRAAPRLGEHNAEIYCERLGLSEDELKRLQAAGVV